MYTKGDWKVEKIRQGEYNLCIRQGKATKINSIKFGLISPEEAEANAQLMAAAPDLYEVLKETTMWVAKASADGSAIAGRALTRINKALAKADGGK